MPTTKPDTKTAHTPAIVSSLPSFSGDGYGYGGGSLVTFGGSTVQFGDGSQARVLAAEVARRWNCHDELMAALRQMLVNSEVDGNTYRDCHKKAVAAIEHAEGRQS